MAENIYFTKGEKDSNNREIYISYIVSYDNPLYFDKHDGVYPCYKNDTSENPKIKYSIKLFYKMDDYNNELEALKKISKNDICQEYLPCMKDYGISYETGCIVFENLETYTTLNNYIKNTLFRDYANAPNIFFAYSGKLTKLIYKLAKGLQTLHDNKISHFDLKFDNIMVQFDEKKNEFNVKYINYGMAMQCDDEHTHSGKDGSANFIDPYTMISLWPENIRIIPNNIDMNGKLVCYKSDLYSLGMIIVEMIHVILNKSFIYNHKETPLFNNINIPTVHNKIITDYYNYILTENLKRKLVIDIYWRNYPHLFQNKEYDITSIFSIIPNERNIVLFPAEESVKSTENISSPPENTPNNTTSQMNGGKQIPPYTIRRYTYGKARKLGVRVRPSTKKDKKLDVFRHNKKIASIGARGMGDYPTFRQTRGQTFANRRRRAYKIRHQRDRTKRWSRGWLADQLLW
jgi:serine/threonine protein kinase